MKFKKVLHTVRYMTFRQWKYRLFYMFRNKMMKRKPCCKVDISNVNFLSLNYAQNINNIDAIAIAEEICNGSFYTVSNIVKTFEKEIDWNLLSEEYRLVCFKLNSFKWLLDLSDAYKVSGDEKYISRGFELIEDWYRNCGSIISGDKWNPYVVAERIMNWIGFCSEYYSVGNRDISVYARWICEHANELNASIEYQLGANHLLSEGKALVCAGVFFNNKDFINCGKNILQREYKEQFMEDGGHYERSVSYHVESLQQYFETYIILSFCNISGLDSFDIDLSDAYQYLNDMISVNGKIPLFNDAAVDYPFYCASDFLATAGLLFEPIPPKAKIGPYFERWNIAAFKRMGVDWKAKRLYEETGYFHDVFTCENKKYSFYFDVADGGPDYNLGHTHADALSVLLSSTDKDILVDTGVFTYKQGDERNDCRSTKAHNTVEIDNDNSAEIWSAFRVARRGHAKLLEYRESEEERYICASHDGYSKCLNTPLMHKRSVRISDNVIEIHDWLEGTKTHSAIARFHIGSQCVVRKLDETHCMIDNDIILGCTYPLKVTNCNVAEYFGIKEATKCIEIMFDINRTSELITKIVIGKGEKNG